MKDNQIAAFSLQNNSFNMDDFEDAMQNSMRRYSLRQLNFMDDISQENISYAVQKSMQVCNMVGVNGVQHFKKVYVYNPDISTMQIDWRMTKKGLNLMVMHTPSMNEKMARWLWELADL